MSTSTDKRFAPTTLRRDRAKREGNVPQSAELTGIAAFAAGTLGALAALALAAGAAVAAVHAAAARANVAPALALLAVAALLPAGSAAAAAVVAGLAQGGGLHLRALKVNGAALNPFSGLRRMFGAEAAVALARASIAFVATLAAMLPLAHDVLAAAVTLSSPATAAAIVVNASLRAIGVALAAGAVFAIADYALVRRRWLSQLKMSFEEIKREAREHEGDPHAKARRKSLHRSVLRNALERTREASFVVVNPTHVAVALRYEPPEVPVPEIIVRAADEAALRVRELAREHGIPIVEDIALARLLFATGEAGRAIPHETFVAVAQVVASLSRAGVLT